MAQIIFYKNPLSEADVESFISKGTLRYALRQIGQENSPLSVTINGITPDELDLDTILGDTDIVEIRRMVHGGGGDSGTKSTLATVVQIAALVAVSMTGVGALGAAAILLGGSIVAGALNKWAQDLANTGGANAEVQNAAVQANDYSAKSATNKARPLSPVTLPMGSHRYAPDVQADVYRYSYGGIYTVSNSDPFSSLYNYGLDTSNGPMALSNSWVTMPASYISPGLPKHPIKIAPYGFTEKTSGLTPAEINGILYQVKQSYLDSLSGDYIRTNYNYYSIGSNFRAYQPVIYHFDDADQYKGRFNWLFTMLRSGEIYASSGASFDDYGSFSDYWDLMRVVFNGTSVGTIFIPELGEYVPFSYDTQYFTGDRYKLGPSYAQSYPIGLVAPVMPKIRNELLLMNNGSYSSTPKTSSYSASIVLTSKIMTQNKPSIPLGTQVFNFGIGDLSVTYRTVGSVPMVLNQEQAGFIPIIKTGANKWTIPWYTPPGTPFAAQFFENVKSFQPRELINPTNNDSLIPVDNNNTSAYNFVFFSGPPGCDRFEFALSGRVYKTSPTGFQKNTTVIQAQFKYSNESVWTNASFLGEVVPFISVENSNTQNIHLPYSIHAPISAEKDPTKFLEVRIRKVTKDSTDNEGDYVSVLSVVDACFVESETTRGLHGLYALNKPMNLEGLYVSGIISSSGSSSEFTGMVESKCWVFNFNTETWSWAFTRNPAFWFLYFARGGFLNDSADGQLTFPYSPTYGWVNYPGHPNNTEHIFGGGYKDEEIDMDKILEWAFFCEDQGLKMDMVVRDDTSVADILERIANIGRASVSYVVGKLSVVIEDPAQTPVAMFGMGNILSGSFSVQYSVGDPVKKVIGTFTNRVNWESDQVEAVVPFSAADTIKEISITLDGITEKGQAQREINILAARQFYQKRTYEWETDSQGYLVKRGDLVLLSHDSTQYGFSGVAREFIVESGVVLGIKTGSIIDSSVSYVTLKLPDSDLVTLSCRYESDSILFEEAFPIESAPYYLSEGVTNELSDFDKSWPEDFTFIADIKQTTGKRVRISESQAQQDGTFKFTAVDEDPAMWAYEYENLISPESFDDSSLVAHVFGLEAKDLGDGFIKLMWTKQDCHAVQLINKNTNQPIEVNGSFAIYDEEVTIELSRGLKTKVEVSPLTYSTINKESAEIEVWPL